MLYLNVEAMNARNADLRRAAEGDRRHRASRAAHHAPSPEPRRRGRRLLRSSAAATVTRLAR